MPRLNACTLLALASGILLASALPNGAGGRNGGGKGPHGGVQDWEGDGHVRPQRPMMPLGEKAQNILENMDKPWHDAWEAVKECKQTGGAAAADPDDKRPCLKAGWERFKESKQNHTGDDEFDYWDFERARDHAQRREAGKRMCECMAGKNFTRDTAREARRECFNATREAVTADFQAEDDAELQNEVDDGAVEESFNDFRACMEEAGADKEDCKTKAHKKWKRCLGVTENHDGPGPARRRFDEFADKLRRMAAAHLSEEHSACRDAATESENEQAAKEECDRMLGARTSALFGGRNGASEDFDRMENERKAKIAMERVRACTKSAKEEKEQEGETDEQGDRRRWASALHQCVREGRNSGPAGKGPGPKAEEAFEQVRELIETARKVATKEVKTCVRAALVDVEAPTPEQIEAAAKDCGETFKPRWLGRDDDVVFQADMERGCADEAMEQFDQCVDEATDDAAKEVCRAERKESMVACGVPAAVMDTLARAGENRKMLKSFYTCAVKKSFKECTKEGVQRAKQRFGVDEKEVALRFQEAARGKIREFIEACQEAKRLNTTLGEESCKAFAKKQIRKLMPADGSSGVASDADFANEVARGAGDAAADVWRLCKRLNKTRAECKNATRDAFERAEGTKGEAWVWKARSMMKRAVEAFGRCLKSGDKTKEECKRVAINFFRDTLKGDAEDFDETFFDKAVQLRGVVTRLVKQNKLRIKVEIADRKGDLKRLCNGTDATALGQKLADAVRGTDGELVRDSVKCGQHEKGRRVRALFDFMLKKGASADEAKERVRGEETRNKIKKKMEERSGLGRSLSESDLDVAVDAAQDVTEEAVDQVDNTGDEPVNDDGTMDSSSPIMAPVKSVFLVTLLTSAVSLFL